MKILVTGGFGFIGRWVVKRLLDDNNKVWVLDDLSNGRAENLDEFRDVSNLNIIIGDIRDKSLIEEVFKNDFDVCIHAAAVGHINESIENPQKYFDINVMGTLNLLNKAKEHGTKFVFISTCMIYNEAKNKLIDEKHNLKPSSPYVASKMAAENAVMAYYHTYNLPVTILRPFNTYGPFQLMYYEGESPTFMGVIPTFTYRKIQAEPLMIYGDGSQTRDFMYVEDCAEFIVKASQSNELNGEVLNAGSGKDISITELALIISDNDPTKIKYIPHHHPQSEVPKLICDYTKAKSVIGWEPRTSLKRGLDKTEEWIKNEFF